MTLGFAQVGDDLYREIILDHYRNPRHRGEVDPATVSLEASNPLCGDELGLTLRIEDDQVTAVRFTGIGCSISQASASMMCEEVSGRCRDDAIALAQRFRAMLIEGAAADDLGDLEALQGVQRYPARIKCAILAWNALLQGLGSPVASNDGSEVTAHG
ncbi:MAG: Fe-S cluster assembly sulfur transfer protein SufU [Candidatus Dormibacteria bacterium]